MSERWVLLPEELTEEMLEAATVNERSDRSDGEIMIAWEMLLDSRPPVSREWLDAAVERGLDAYAGKTPWHHGYTALAVINIRADFRAAILAALEMTDG